MPWDTGTNFPHPLKVHFRGEVHRWPALGKLTFFVVGQMLPIPYFPLFVKPNVVFRKIQAFTGPCEAGRVIGSVLRPIKLEKLDAMCQVYELIVIPVVVSTTESIVRHEHYVPWLMF